MPMDARFLQRVETLRAPAMGTEHVGPLLYALVRGQRPRNVLEVGLGYTSAFLARALVDARDDWEQEKSLLESDPDDERTWLLRKGHFDQPYAPALHAVDDFSTEGTTAPAVMRVLEELELDGVVTLHQGDFRGLAARMDARTFPLDFVWFDCGGVDEYVAFLREYWPLINPDHGLLALHFTYWCFQIDPDDPRREALLPNPLLNAIKKQQMRDGDDARFEVLSLVEPWKHRQGSVTLIRKLGPASRTRDTDFQAEMKEVFGESPPDMPRL